MNLSRRDRRALILLGVALAAGTILHFVVGDNTARVAPVSSAVTRDAAAFAQQRLVKLRQLGATASAREAALKQASADLADRERGIIQADTAPQAQAALVEIARRVGKLEQVDVH